jgi:hypothetical protein
MFRVVGGFLLFVLLTSRGSAGDPGTSPDDRGPGAAPTRRRGMARAVVPVRPHFMMLPRRGR